MKIHKFGNPICTKYPSATVTTQQFIKFGVIKESPLAQFLQCNGYTMSEFSLQEIWKVLREGLTRYCGPDGTDMLLCSPKLERVFGSSSIMRKDLLCHLEGQIVMLAGDNVDTYFTMEDEHMNSKVSSFINQRLMSFLGKNIFGYSLTFKKIIETVMEMIKRERMYDRTNPSIIMCNNDLFKALDKQVLHVSQICNVIKRCVVLEPLNCNSPGKINFDFIHPEDLKNFKKADLVYLCSPITSNPVTDLETAEKFKAFCNPNSRFTLDDNLRQVFSAVVDISSKTEFSVAEVNNYLRLYIIQKKDKFLLKSNPEVLLLGDDILADAFGARTLYQPQLKKFMSKSMTLVKPDSNRTVTQAKSNCMGQESSSCTERKSESVPPRLSKSISLPARSSPSVVELLDRCGRKRTNSGDIETDSAKVPRIDKRDPIQLLANCSKILQSSSNTAATKIITNKAICLKSVTDEDTLNEDSDGGSHEKVERHGQDVTPTTAMNICDDDSSDFDESSTCYRCTGSIKPGMKYCLSCWREHQRQLSARPKPKWRYSRKGIQSNETDDCNLSDVKQDADTVFKTATSENNIETRPTTPDTAVESEEILPETQRLETTSGPVAKLDSGFCSTVTQCSDTFDMAANSRRNSLVQVRADLYDAEDKEGVDEVDGGSTQHNNILKEIPVEKETHKFTNIISKENTSRSVEAISSSICLICRTNQKDASLIHGRTGHQEFICCYPCGKNIWKQKRRCPACKRTVEKVIRNIVL